MQKIKRIVKKIGAISTGAVFLGASLVGAMAADLSTYPNPFVVSGASNSAVIAVSDNTFDTTAGGYVLSGLAGAITPTSGGATVTDVDGAYKLQKSGNKFNLNNTGYDIDTKLTKSELAVLLAKTTYVDDEGTNTDETEYSQKLFFTDRRANGEKTIQYIYDQNKEDSDRPMGDYIYLSKSSNVDAWTYEFNLDNAVTVANAADVQSTKLELLGRTFTISGATVTNGNVTKLTLLAGDVTQIIATGDTVNGVTVVSVDATTGSAKCTIEYAGTTYTINDASTKTMPDGTIIGVTKVIASNKQATPDYCELNIGADKVELEDSKKVKVNGEYVEGSEVTFSGSNFDQFNVSFKPDDRVYMKIGDEYADPVFGAFKLIFGGIVETDMEDITITASGDGVDITATNMDGDTTTWTAFYVNTTGSSFIRAAGGTDSPMIYIEGDYVTNESLGSDIEGLGDMDSYDIRFLYSKDKRSHILKITDIDTRNNETDFLDETTGTSYVDQDFTYNGAGTTFNNVMPQAFILNFTLGNGLDTAAAGDTTSNRAKIEFIDINDKGPLFYTENEGNLTFNMLWNKSVDEAQLYRQNVGPTAIYALEFTEVDSGVESDAVSGTDLRHLMINFTYDETDKEIDIAGVLSETFSHGTTALKQKDGGETTVKAGKTAYGTYIEQLTPTSSGTDTLLIQYPEEATYAEIWMSPIGATVTTSTEAATGIDIKTASEITDISLYNAIVVGGPAANEIAANLLGLTYPAIAEASGLAAGEAVLKMVENGANTALLVFGWETDDTKRAAKVIESYDNFALTGEEVKVEGILSNPTIAE